MLHNASSPSTKNCMPRCWFGETRAVGNSSVILKKTLFQQSYRQDGVDCLKYTHTHTLVAEAVVLDVCLCRNAACGRSLVQLGAVAPLVRLARDGPTSRIKVGAVWQSHISQC